ncbi:MAG: IS66 family insertion sequence element accessory protein TnpB [Gammaproteobacteria bacterium]|nr:IS66 family insertion sequence element accessory protein TnpB [Gammaproteobacteria bacterium]
MSKFEIAGQSVKEFCTTNKISQGSFYKWRQQLAGPQTGSPFVDISDFVPNSVPAGTPWRIELDLGDGLILRLKRG